MQSRSYIENKLDSIESKLNLLKLSVQRQAPIEEFLKTIDEAKANLQEVKDSVGREPMTRNEQNIT